MLKKFLILDNEISEISGISEISENNWYICL